MANHVDQTTMPAAAHGMRGRRSFCACIALAVGLAGCAVTPKVPDVSWPDPPDKPRIRYLRSLQSRP
jgi:hypothetical protein